MPQFKPFYTVPVVRGMKEVIAQLKSKSKTLARAKSWTMEIVVSQRRRMPLQKKVKNLERKYSEI